MECEVDESLPSVLLYLSPFFLPPFQGDLGFAVKYLTKNCPLLPSVAQSKPLSLKRLLLETLPKPGSSTAEGVYTMSQDEHDAYVRQEQLNQSKKSA